jgi:hypothetical protein
MPFLELEKYKRQAPQLADKLSQLENYLAEILERSVPTAIDLDHAAYDIVPILVAKNLDIDENLALLLLGTFEGAGVIVHRYHIYCPNTDRFIDGVDSKGELPLTLRCPFEERTEHSINEYFVELVFSFSPKFVRGHKLAIAM